MPNPKYEYQTGGSLPADAPSYVSRQADQYFYQYLKNSEFCYVLNARQMGKSSLQVRTMHRLQDEGFACAVIDVSSIGSKDTTTQEQWYAGIIRILVNDLGLKRGFDLETWWQTHSLLSPEQHFSLFIEEILFTRISKNIVIFIDESEGIHHFHFGQYFFVLIRYYYNQRSDNPAYKRLTFAILGVASPSDLIANKKLTPFNIGRAIDLSEFQLDEAMPLAEGLAAKTSHPETLLQIVLGWTGGQPFLTQKLCKLISDSDAPLPEGQETTWIEQLVKTKIVAHWESQDEQMHLINIRNRILHEGGQKTGRLLGMYQQVLQQGEILADDSREQLDLRLSGLVVRRKNKLFVYNKIYVLVFDNIWIENTLATLRPYAEFFNAWRDSKFLDESYLLRGQALQKAQNWKKNKSLSEEDHRFLNASQTLEQKETEKALNAQIQIQANQFKAQRRFYQILLIILMITLGPPVGVVMLEKLVMYDEYTGVNAAYIETFNGPPSAFRVEREGKKLKKIAPFKPLQVGDKIIVRKPTHDLEHIHNKENSITLALGDGSFKSLKYDDTQKQPYIVTATDSPNAETGFMNRFYRWFYRLWKNDTQTVRMPVR
jgi:hypothetical protein